MHRKIWAISSLIWIALLVFSPLLIVPQPVEAVPDVASNTETTSGYVIDGNSVYTQTADTYIRATPATLTASGWVTVNFKSTKYIGDVDIVFGFNGYDQVQTVKAESWENYTHTLYRTVKQEKTAVLAVNKVVSTKALVKGSKVPDIGDATLNDLLAEITYEQSDLMGKGIKTTTSIIAYMSISSNNITYKYYADIQEPYTSTYEDWKKSDDIFTTQSKSYIGASKWQAKKYSQSVVKDILYTARFWVEIPFKGKEVVSGKYNIAIKPSSLTVDQAITSNNIATLDPWYSSSWSYRKQLTVVHTDDGAQSFYQMKRTLLFAGTTCNATHLGLDSKSQTDFDDIRFTTTNGTTLLDYWIESKVDSSYAIVWVEVDVIPAHPNDTTIYVYYGNAGAATASSGANTFAFFDDFPGVALDTVTNWTITLDNGGISVGASILTLPLGTGVPYGSWIYSKTTFPVNRRFRGLMKFVNNTSYQSFGFDSSPGAANRTVFYSNFTTGNVLNALNGTVADGNHAHNLGNVGHNAYNIFDVCRNSTTDARYYLNDLLLDTNPTFLPLGSLPVSLFAQAQVLYSDWVFVSNYTVNEPTWGACASEELCSPIVVILSSTNVEETTVTLTGNVTGTCTGCTVINARGFAYGTTSNATIPAGTEKPPDSYTANWSENNSWGVGSFSSTGNITGLTSATCYYYKAYATSNCTNNWAWSAESNFLTKPNSPTSANCTASSGQIVVNWAEATGGVGDANIRTIVRYLTTGYPTDVTGAGDGSTLSYNGTALTTTQAGLTNCTPVYFSLWTQIFGCTSNLTTQYSDTPAHTTCTPYTVTVTTGLTTGYSTTWAIVNGTMNLVCGGTITQRGFDYGLTIAYGMESITAGAWSATGNFNATLTTLSAATMYHYRAKVYSGTTWYYGADKVFSTKGSPTLNVFWNTGYSANSSTVQSSNMTYQTFTTNATNVSYSVTSIWLYLAKVGTPGTVTASIKNTSNCTSVQTCWCWPTGSDLTYGTLNGATLSNTFTWYEFVVTEKCLSANTTYAIVLKAAGDATNYVLWGLDGDGGYAGGNYGYSIDGGSTWVSGCPADALFEIWGNPCINVEQAKVFSSYQETNDWLITLLYKNTFEPYYTQAADVSRYFYIQLYNVAGTVMLAQTKCPTWGYRPACIYLNSDQFASLEWGSAYRVRIYGDFSTNPYMEYILQPEDWIGDDLYRLDSWVKSVAGLMEDNDNLTYMILIAGKGLVLNEQGGAIFVTGIPTLSDIRPDVFQVVTQTPGYTHSTFTGGTAPVWTTLMGPQITLIFENFSQTLGVNGGTVGALVGLIFYALVAALCFPAGSAIAAISIPSILLVVIAITGFIPMAALGFICAVAAFLLLWQFYALKNG